MFALAGSCGTVEGSDVFAVSSVHARSDFFTFDVLIPAHRGLPAWAADTSAPQAPVRRVVSACWCDLEDLFADVNQRGSRENLSCDCRVRGIKRAPGRRGFWTNLSDLQPFERLHWTNLVTFYRLNLMAQIYSRNEACMASRPSPPISICMRRLRHRFIPHSNKTTMCCVSSAAFLVPLWSTFLDTIFQLYYPVQ